MELSWNTDQTSIVIPSWEFPFPNARQFCHSAPMPPPPPSPSSLRSAGRRRRIAKTNDRLVWLSLPTGDAPSGGWPVWISLVTDSFQADPQYGTGTGVVCNSTRAAGLHTSRFPFKGFYPFSLPAAANASSSAGKATWNYDQEAGAMWNQRLKQHVIANGIAVLVVNPIAIDSWDAGPWWWNGGVDKLYLSSLFTHLASGARGPLDMTRISIRGYSSGAQMVSWLFEVAINPLYEWDTLFHGVTIKGGVMMSGGSYQCYADVNDKVTPSPPIGSCKGCTTPSPDFCAPGNRTRDAGWNVTKCQTCDVNVVPYCGQCCPRNYTEAYYEDDHARYAKHPPVLLAQASLSDDHADLCAARNYYETLQAHGVANAKLVLMSHSEQRCFCVGDEKDPASADSPFARLCDGIFGNTTRCDASSNGNAPDCCISHALAFASAVRPSVEWALAVL